MAQPDPSRREVIRNAIAAGVGTLAGGALLRAEERTTPAPSQAAPSLRFAHLSDMHVQPERRAADGYAAALDSLRTLDPQPQFIITGGDHVMDSFRTDADRAKLQWDLYEKTYGEHTKLPAHPVVGNHDVYAWGAEPAVDEKTAGYGKAMYLDRMGLKRTWYGFDAGGWRFLCLDNIGRRATNYFGSIDDEQMEWLTGELKAADSRPIAIVSHIPIVTMCAVFYHQEMARPTEYAISDGQMQHDALKLVKLLHTANVRLCLSGHIHMVDRVDYLGMNFICDGAVSGNWWKGHVQEFAEGYGVIDLMPDGTFRHEYRSYGWQAAVG